MQEEGNGIAQKKYNGIAQKTKKIIVDNYNIYMGQSEEYIIEAIIEAENDEEANMIGEEYADEMYQEIIQSCSALYNIECIEEDDEEE